MAEKPHKRILKVWARRKVKIRNRKFNPPVKGRKTSLQETNRLVIDAIMAKIS